jgi:hypothetical protein
MVHGGCRRGAAATTGFDAGPGLFCNPIGVRLGCKEGSPDKAGLMVVLPSESQEVKSLGAPTQRGASPPQVDFRLSRGLECLSPSPPFIGRVSCSLLRCCSPQTTNPLVPRPLPCRLIGTVSSKPRHHPSAPPRSPGSPCPRQRSSGVGCRRPKTHSRSTPASTVARFTARMTTQRHRPFDSMSYPRAC